MAFLILLQRLVVLCIIAALGVFAQKKGILTLSAQHSMREVMLKLSVPFAILSSANMAEGAVPRKDILMMFAIAAFSMLLFFVVAQIICRKKKLGRADRAATILSMMFGNTLFIGLPLADAVLGATGMFYLAMYNLLGAILTWTYGVGVADSSDGIDWKKLLLNPSAIASVFLLILVIVDFQLPAFVMDFSKIMGGMSSPLSMLLLGAMLAESRLREIFTNGLSYLVSFLRLVAIPLVCLVVLRLLNVPSVLLQVSVICIALPVGALNPNIIKNGGLDPTTANAMVVQSTIFSLLTLPLLMLFVEMLMAIPF